MIEKGNKKRMSGLGIACTSFDSDCGTSHMAQTALSCALKNKGKNNMKKIMVMGAAALCGAVALADVTSANVVGYQNKTQRQQFNYVTPTFRPIAGLVGVDSNEMSINEIQMGADKATGSVKFQFLTSGGGMAVEYVWVKAADVSKYKDITVSTEGLNGVWAKKKSGMKTDYRDPEGTDAEPNTLKVGQGVQIGASEGDIVQFNGQVAEETVSMITRTARQQFNYFGNPFPADVSINNIQIGAEKATGSVKLQFLTSGGGMAVEYVWVKAADVSKYKDITVSTEGLNGVWAKKKSGMKTDYRDPEGTDAEPNVVKAGECIQLGCTEGDQYWILCPYDL